MTAFIFFGRVAAGLKWLRKNGMAGAKARVGFAAFAAPFDYAQGRLKSCPVTERPFKTELAAMCLAALACVLLPMGLAAQADTQWVLDQSTLSYHMSHPMHEVDGVSHAAKGKGTCHAGQCNFLIAAPVKSFDSGDTNRDLHMMETTRGAQFPMVVVRTSFPEAETSAGTIDADLTVEFAGQSAHYAHVAFQRTMQGNEVHISGTIPTTCSDFKIDRPTFLTVPIKNEIPVKVEMSWHKM